MEDVLGKKEIYGWYAMRFDAEITGRPGGAILTEGIGEAFMTGGGVHFLREKGWRESTESRWLVEGLSQTKDEGRRGFKSQRG